MCRQQPGTNIRPAGQETVSARSHQPRSWSAAAGSRDPRLATGRAGSSAPRPANKSCVVWLSDCLDVNLVGLWYLFVIILDLKKQKKTKTSKTKNPATLLFWTVNFRKLSVCYGALVIRLASPAVWLTWVSPNHRAPARECHRQRTIRKEPVLPHDPPSPHFDVSFVEERLDVINMRVVTNVHSLSFARLQ